MLDRKVLEQINYKQTGDYCILASYAVAASAFTGERDVLSYFDEFCQIFSHLGTYAAETARQHSIPFDPIINSEASYLLYMGIYFNRINPMPWYKAIELLHNRGLSPLFRKAKRSFSIKMIDSGHAHSTDIEVALKDHDLTLANVCLDHTQSNGRSGVHSVTVGYDQNGFYYFDVNLNAVIPIVENNLIDWAISQQYYTNARLGNAMIFNTVV